MSEQTRGSESARALPDRPSIEWLRKEAKRRLALMRATASDAKLADAQLAVARAYGFKSWRAMKAHIDSRSAAGPLFDALEAKDVARFTRLLDEHPESLEARNPPYGWTLLHTAAQQGLLDVVDLLLERGISPNVREEGDNTYPMHWAAAAGHVDVVRRLADAGGDVVGRGDDHELEVIGWASCWDGCDDDAHRAVIDLLLSRGARHHIFSAISMNFPDVVRNIVTDDPGALNRRLSRNENNQLPLHFAVNRRRPEMIRLLLELGADPLARDGVGYPAAIYARTPDLDRDIMRAIRKVTGGELESADRGHRRARGVPIDLLASLSLGDWPAAERLARDNPALLREGVLHLAAKRGDVPAVQWLLDHGADPNERWAHFEAEVTALHLAAWIGHLDVVRRLLAAGADPTIHDSQFESGAVGWAEHGGHAEIVRLLREASSR